MVFKFGDVYWNSALFIKLVEVVMQILSTAAEFKYPVSQNTLLFHFDQSSGYGAYVDDRVATIQYVDVSIYCL